LVYFLSNTTWSIINKYFLEFPFFAELDYGHLEHHPLQCHSDAYIYETLNFAQRKKNELSLLHNHYETLLQRTQYETLLQRNQYETLLQRNQYEPLLQHNQYETLLQRNQDEMPLLHNLFETLLHYNQFETPLLRNHYEMSLLRSQYETPLFRNHYRMSLLHNHYETQLLRNRLEYETTLLNSQPGYQSINKLYKFTSISSSDEPIIFKCFLHWDTSLHKIKPLLHAQQINEFSYNFTFSLFSTTFICSNLEYSFHCNFMQRHDYFTYWLEHHLNYISSCSYSYCISRRKKKVAKKNRPSNETTYPSSINNNDDSCYFENLFCGGGRHQTFLNGEVIYEHLQSCENITLLKDVQYFKGKKFEFKRYKLANETSNDESDPICPLFLSKVPLHQLSTCLNLKELKELSILHGISIPANITKKTMLAYFHDHHCNQCDLYISVFTENQPNITIRAKKNSKLNKKTSDSTSKFPPDPPSDTLVETIIREFCNDTAPQNLVEGGCAICGLLLPLKNMVLLNEIRCDLDVISPCNVGRQERLCTSDPVVSLKGPILAENCEHVCQTCHAFLKKGKKPPQSLANSFWIGNIPTVLQNLTFAEKMLISKIRHNKCLVRVSSGRAKMTANVIMFSNPTVTRQHK
jgi:hypothetical protein